MKSHHSWGRGKLLGQIQLGQSRSWSPLGLWHKSSWGYSKLHTYVTGEIVQHFMPQYMLCSVTVHCVHRPAGIREKSTLILMHLSWHLLYCGTCHGTCCIVAPVSCYLLYNVAPVSWHLFYCGTCVMTPVVLWHLCHNTSLLDILCQDEFGHWQIQSTC